MTNDLRKQAMTRQIADIKNAGTQRVETFKMTQRFHEAYCKQALNEFYEKHGEKL